VGGAARVGRTHSRLGPLSLPLSLFSLRRLTQAAGGWRAGRLRHVAREEGGERGGELLGGWVGPQRGGATRARGAKVVSPERCAQNTCL